MGLDLDAARIQMAKVIAINVRNAMEDFHVEHLTDDQMADLNPLIRNAIYEALVILQEATAGTGPERETAAQMLSHLTQMIPGYWEEPVLSEGVAEALGKS